MSSCCEIERACRSLRNSLETDSLPRQVGEKFNALEGVGALCYQPCIYSLSKTIRAFEEWPQEGWALVAQKVVGVALLVLTSLIAAVGFVMKRIGSIMPHDRTPKTDAVFVKTSPEKIDHLYDIIQEFSEAAAEIGLDYRMNSGTALGAIRNKGIIPHDDDGDFVILKSEKEKVEKAAKDGVFQKRGLEVQFYPGMENFEIRFTKEERIKRGYADAADLDLFLVERAKVIEDGQVAERIVYSSPFFADHFPHDYFTAEEWDKSVEWVFGPGAKIRIRGVTEEAMKHYVQRAYGDDCLTCGLMTHSHAEINLFGFTFSGLGIPVVTREKVQIVNFAPAQGNKWKGECITKA